MKSIETTNHWNDRYYESTECSKCGNMEMEKTMTELEKAVDNHNCQK